MVSSSVLLMLKPMWTGTLHLWDLGSGGGRLFALQDEKEKVIVFCGQRLSA
jgi:hypothetical protein